MFLTYPLIETLHCRVESEMGGPEAETPVVESPVEPLNEEVVRVEPKKAIEKSL